MSDYKKQRNKRIAELQKKDAYIKHTIGLNVYVLLARMNGKGKIKFKECV